MTRSARWIGVAVIAAASATVSCSDIATPNRNDLYEWRLIVPSASGSGNDSLTFRWPQNRLPVRVWVEDAASLRTHVPDAIAAWRKAFLYGEFDAAVVSDSSTADVIVRAGAAPGVQFSHARLRSAFAPGCSGATDLDISDDHSQLRLPIRVYLDPRFDPEAPGLQECLALTATHELGHALGIWRHSGDAADLMFRDPAVAAPSERDLETAEVLYHLTPNVAIADRTPGPVPLE